MHARFVDLLSIRDGEPVDLATRSHVASCPQCASALAETARTAGLLRALPMVPPATGTSWSVIEQRLAARAEASRRRARLASLAAAASVAALALFASMRVSERAPDPAAADRAGDVAAADEVATLRARSQALEAVLAALPQRPAVERAGTSLPIETLEAQVQWLDHQITSAGASASALDEERLWRDRVETMNSLVQLRYVEAQGARL
jgi:hypothetical protein